MTSNKPAEINAAQLRRYLAGIVAGRLAGLRSRASGEDSELENIWEELCAQVQIEESVLFDAYEDMVDSELREALEGLSQTDRQKLWLESEAAVDWEPDSPEDAPPVLLEDLVPDLRDELMSMAADYESRALEKFNARQHGEEEPESESEDGEDGEDDDYESETEEEDDQDAGEEEPETLIIEQPPPTQSLEAAAASTDTAFMSLLECEIRRICEQRGIRLAVGRAAFAEFVKALDEARYKADQHSRSLTAQTYFALGDEAAFHIAGLQSGNPHSEAIEELKHIDGSLRRFNTTIERWEMERRMDAEAPE